MKRNATSGDFFSSPRERVARSSSVGRVDTSRVTSPKPTARREQVYVSPLQPRSQVQQAQPNPNGPDVLYRGRAFAKTHADSPRYSSPDLKIRPMLQSPRRSSGGSTSYINAAQRLNTPSPSPRKTDFWDTDESNRAKSARPSARSDCIRVCLRVRPYLAKPDSCVSTLAVATDEVQRTVTIKCERSDKPEVRLANGTKRFEFDEVFSPTATQEDVFDRIGRGLVSDTLKGYNTCLFAYGQTGSGKTYSLIGDVSASALMQPNTTYSQIVRGSAFDSKVGLVPRIVQELFRLLQREDDRHDVSTKVVLSFCEIYNEVIFDLLSRDVTPVGLELAEDSQRRVSVPKLSKHSVTDVETVLKLLNQGFIQRRTTETKMNICSSRSHCILQVALTSSETGRRKRIESVMTIVDLAGSERQSKAAHTSIERREESIQINRSLLSLGRALNALGNREKFTPMRDSKLTRLLSEYLGGNCKTVMLSTVSPSLFNMSETLCSLEFTHHSGAIKQNAVINEVYDVEESRSEIRKLEQKVNEQRLQLQMKDRNLVEKDMIITQLTSELEHLSMVYNSLRMKTLGKRSESPPSPKLSLDPPLGQRWEEYSRKLVGVDLDTPPHSYDHPSLGNGWGFETRQWKEYTMALEHYTPEGRLLREADDGCRRSVDNAKSLRKTMELVKEMRERDFNDIPMFVERQSA